MDFILAYARSGLPGVCCFCSILFGWSGIWHTANDGCFAQALSTPAKQSIGFGSPLTDSPPIINGEIQPTKLPNETANELQSLLEMQLKIKEVLPSVLPCVVSIEGGSGVIIDNSGIILTASHVTQKAGRVVNVHFADGRMVSATTLGTNYNTDTAALKLNSPGPWPHVSIADSNNVQRGDWCLALGYPLSFRRGEPAAVRIGRVLEIDETKLVTDCPIMGGDSGGPLLTLNGNLIGVSSRVKNNIADNVHVPVQLFLDDWPKLSASVDVRKRSVATHPKAYLGIQGETDIDRVRIRSVHQGSPAETAGLLAEDVLLALDGKPIDTFDDVLEILDHRQPGERVVAKLNRYGELLSVPIELGQK